MAGAIRTLDETTHAAPHRTGRPRGLLVAALIPAGKRLLWWIIAAVIGGGMVWQRTLINAHWLSDTLFGLAAGAATTLIIWWAYYLLLQKDYGKPFFGRTITADAAVASPVGGNA